jgi:hypothetical protein
LESDKGSEVERGPSLIRLDDEQHTIFLCAMLIRAAMILRF